MGAVRYTIIHQYSGVARCEVSKWFSGDPMTAFGKGWLRAIGARCKLPWPWVPAPSSQRESRHWRVHMACFNAERVQLVHISRYLQFSVIYILYRNCQYLALPNGQYLYHCTFSPCAVPSTATINMTSLLHAAEPLANRYISVCLCTANFPYLKAYLGSLKVAFSRCRHP